VCAGLFSKNRRFFRYSVSMQRLYASTFIAGAGTLVRELLVRTLSDVEFEREDDGLVLYRTKASVQQLRALRFFHNTYAVLTFADAMDPSDPLVPLIKLIRQDEELASHLRSVLPGKSVACTVMASVENQPSAIPTIHLQKLEKALEATGCVRIDRTAPKQFLWLIARREGYAFFGLLLNEKQQYDRKLQKGELRPELAHLLCLLSNPNADDVFLDPCAGHGAILRERIAIGRCAKIMGGDSDAGLVSGLRKEFGKARSVSIDVTDATELKTVPDASVDVIVTDPPWGVFDRSFSVSTFAPVFFATCRRVLKPGGRLIVLTAREGEYETSLAQAKGLSRTAYHDILVSGQKARIHCIRAM
jgi:ubiquinone/menaquinone biosynthesis C-methylase UbiE